MCNANSNLIKFLIYEILLQEEEMLDLGEVTPPRGISVTLVAATNNHQIITKMPTFGDNEAALSLTPTASPQMGLRLHPTPSPDSAIHSASGCHSPSQSPIQSRQLSGLSSPFSIRGTPSLSRNNSDASQHGNRVDSPGAPMSPMTLGHMPSPQNSPIPNRHILGRQITLPSSPLPPSTIANQKPMTMYQGVVLTRHEDGVEGTNEGVVTEISSMTAPPGISRQQLINRYVHCLQKVFPYLLVYML